MTPDQAGGTSGGSGLPWVWSPDYVADIGPHVFPMEKYRLTKERLVAEGTLSEDDLHVPEPATRDQLLAAHDARYVDKVLAGDLSPSDELLLELPFSPGLLKAFRVCCGGTILAARLAVEAGRAAGGTAADESTREPGAPALSRGAVAVHLGGGFHHAFADHGEGFCLLNDVAVAAAVLRAEGIVERVAVVDLDVHHGNGTAAIFRDDPSVFTFSMHQEQNYPLIKPPGDLDVALENRMGDERYLDLLREHLPTVLDHRPDLVLYLAGADPYRHDQLGGLDLSRAGLRERDATVFAGCRDAGVPVAVVLAGGYARNQDDTIEIHCDMVRGLRG